MGALALGMMQDHDSLLGRRANGDAEVTGAARLWLCNNESWRRLRSDTGVVAEAVGWQAWVGVGGQGAHAGQMRVLRHARLGKLGAQGGRSKRRPMCMLISGVNSN